MRLSSWTSPRRDGSEQAMLQATTPMSPPLRKQLEGSNGQPRQKLSVHSDTLFHAKRLVCTPPPPAATALKTRGVEAKQEQVVLSKILSQVGVANSSIVFFAKRSRIAAQNICLSLYFLLLGYSCSPESQKICLNCQN
jgi:hypothetical protein